MLTRSVKRLWRWHWAAAPVRCWRCRGVGRRTGRRGPAGQAPASLELVPENAAFYSSMLRNREQFEAITNSRAWAKLKAMPIVQMGMALYNLQAANPDSPPGRLQAALQDPEVQKDLSLVGDLVSEEVFVYGDKSMVDFVDLAQRLVGAMRYGPIVLQLGGKGHHVPPNRIQEMVFLSALAENVQLLKVPDAVVGFKVRDAAAVKQRLERLEKQANAAPGGEPDAEGAVEEDRGGRHAVPDVLAGRQHDPLGRSAAGRFREIRGHARGTSTRSSHG